MRMGRVPYIDTTGEAHLSSIVRNFSKNGIVLISGLKAQPKSVLKKTGLYDFIGEEHFFEHTGEAIDYALTKVNQEKCIGCKHFVFQECDYLANAEDKAIQAKKKAKVKGKIQEKEDKRAILVQ